MRNPRSSVVEQAGRPRIPLLCGRLPALAVSIILILCSTAQLRAQLGEGDLVFKFKVQGVGDPAEAKPVQHAFLEHDFVTSCDYIAECRCFKLASSIALDYALLNDLLQQFQKELDGAVEVSNGNVLWPPIPDER